MLLSSSLIIASGAYILYSGKKLIDFMNFKKNCQHGDLRMIEAKISSSKTGLKDVIIVQNGTIITECRDALINVSQVSKGVVKTEIYTIPMKVGKTTILMPQTRTYTDYRSIYDNTSHCDDLHLANIKLELSDTSALSALSSLTESTPVQELKMDPYNAGKIFDQLKFTDYRPYNAVKYHFKSHTIKNNEIVTVVGKMNNSKQKMIPNYIGHKPEVLRLVRSRYFTVKYPLVALATLVFGGASLAIINE